VGQGEPAALQAAQYQLRRSARPASRQRARHCSCAASRSGAWCRPTGHRNRGISGAMTDWIRGQRYFGKGDDNAFTQVAQNSGFSATHRGWASPVSRQCPGGRVLFRVPGRSSCAGGCRAALRRSCSDGRSCALRRSIACTCASSCTSAVHAGRRAWSVSSFGGPSACCSGRPRFQSRRADGDRDPGRLYVVSVLGVSTIYQVTVRPRCGGSARSPADLSGAQAARNGAGGRSADFGAGRGPCRCAARRRI